MRITTAPISIILLLAFAASAPAAARRHGTAAPIPSAAVPAVPPMPGMGPVTPAPAAPRGPSMPAGPATGPVASGPSVESWRYWWEYNQDRFLHLRARVAALGGVTTPSTGDELLAPGARTSMRPTADDLRKEATPALLAAAQEHHKELAATAMKSLARDGAASDEVKPLLEQRLADGDRRLAEMAALSLGILARPDALSRLETALAAKDDDGAPGKASTWRTQALAALGIGITAARPDNARCRERAQKILIEYLLSEAAAKSPHKDVRVCAIVGLSMIPDPEQRAVGSMLRYFSENKEKDEYVCGHIPPAVARCARDAASPDRGRAVTEWMHVFDEQGGVRGPHIRSGAAIAIGVLTRAEDPFAAQAVDVLTKVVEKQAGRDPQAAQFALIALGEIAGSGEAGSAVEKMLLERAQVRNVRSTTRAWAALALGIAGFEQRERKGAAPVQDSTSQLLLEKLGEQRDPEQVAAFALALALRRYAPAGAKLLTLLDEVHDDDYRGYLALAVGLMEERKGKKPLEKMIIDSKRLPWVLYESAVALALMGEKDAVPALLEMLAAKENDGSAVQSAVSDALGIIGDYRTLPALSAVLSDKKRTSTSRASAAAALGIVGDPFDVPYHALITRDFNYSAAVETVNDFIWGNK